MLVLHNMAPTDRLTRTASITRMLLWRTTNTVTRLSITVLKIFLMAIVMFLVPRTIHSIVHNFDILQEITGRRARSPFELYVRWGRSVIVALGLLVTWHEVLRRLSYRIVSKDNGGDAFVKTGREEKRGLLNVSWGTVLGRVIIPGMLLGFLVPLVWRVVKYGDMRELVAMNTVDPADDTSAR